MHKQQRQVGLVGKLDKLCGLLSRLGKDYSITGNDADRIARNFCPAAYHGNPIVFFELGKLRSIHNACNDLTDIDGFFQIGRKDAQQFILLVAWRHDGFRRFKIRSMWFEVFYNVTRNVNSIHFVVCQKIGNTRNMAMHGCTPEFFSIGVFIGRHLDQWRPRQKHLGSIFLHNGIVRHARHISTTSRGIAKYD